MSARLRDIELERFKAFQKEQSVNISDLNIWMGANSSGKSSCLQSLLTLKQTCESGQERIGLLLNGKYAALGAFSDVVNSMGSDVEKFSIALKLKSGNDEEAADQIVVKWVFYENTEFISGVGLEKIEICGIDRISMQLSENNQYAVTINGNKFPHKIGLDNLFISDIFIPYDRAYNEMLADFMKETISWASGRRKAVIKIRKDIMVSAQLRGLAIPVQNINTNKTKDIIDLVISVQERIWKMVRRQDDSISLDAFAFLLMPLLMNDVDFTEFEAIWEKYKDKKPEKSKYALKSESVSLENFLNTRERNKYNNPVKWDMLGIYNVFLRDIISSIRYLGPLRENPKSLYQWDMDIDPNYVGVKGEHFSSVLRTLENKEVVTMLPGADEAETVLLSEALAGWCQYLQVASEIHVGSAYSFGMNIKVHNIYDKEADIMNVGIGTSQVLPVLIMGLISPAGTILMYEQPELHLHPYSQSRLADFFIAMSKMGKQIIVETHSEYMLHRLRYHILKHRIEEHQISLTFFANKEEGTSVYQGRLGNDGTIDYPEGFVDQNQSLFIEMLNAKRKY